MALKAQFAPPLRFAGSETVSLFHDGPVALQVMIMILPSPALPGSATAMVSGTLEPIPQP
jgi:hypothetical protein